MCLFSFTFVRYRKDIIRGAQQDFAKLAAATPGDCPWARGLNVPVKPHVCPGITIPGAIGV